MLKNYLVNEVPGGTTDPQTGVVKRKVEIYNGVRWGWENTFTPRGYYTDIIGGGIGGSPSGYYPNDDGTFGSYPLGFSLPFFGNTYDSFYINNNGNISFGSPISAYTPDSGETQDSAPMIAPYWADVDTRGTGTIALRTDIPDQVIVTWDKVGYYNQNTDKTASFQLVLRGPNYPTPLGEGNVGFFYKDVEWETGDASGGTGGFGGTEAAVGFSDGLSSINSGEFTLSGSQQPGINRIVNDYSSWLNLPTSDGDEGGCTGGSGGGGCSSNPGGGGLGYSYQKYKSVPESTSTLGMLVLSAWAIVKTLKHRKNK